MSSSSSSATTTLPVLAFLLLSTAISAAPIIGLDSFLTHQSRIDPQASNDSFLSLPSSIKTPLSHSLDFSSNSLLSLSLPISLSLHLLGDFPSDTPSLLSAFLSAATTTTTHFHVITPFDSHPLSHTLSLSHTLHLLVTPSQTLTSLTNSLSQTLTSHLHSTPSSLRSPLLTIPHSSIDQIIQNHFITQNPNPNPNQVHLYLLNLPPASSSNSKAYAYSYSPGDSSAAVTKCSGTFFTSSHRYFWIDLRAGPVDYGPAISGDGVIPRGEFHPLAALHGRPKSNKAFAADLASLVWSAYHVFLAPSLRISVPFEKSLVIQFIHIHGGNDNKDLAGLDWKSIEKSFRFESKSSGLLLGDQSLSFRQHEIRYSECSICSFAISRSINSYTSRFLFDNYTLIVSEYLDSKRLHQILSDSGDELRKLAGVLEEDFGRVVPVYVFDLDYTSLLLLDRYHQSVAFKDMVIAVRTRNTQTVSDYSCNGRHVFTQTRELERPIVGSILQSMWGVSPTHLNWSPQHNETLVDYTWSMGQTPFGPFSEMLSLSFVQKDAARRNVLLTSLNYSITSAIDVLQSVETHGGAKNLLKQKQHVEFVQRWNLFKYKLNKAMSALSHLDFEMALFYLRSSDHDLYAIHSIVYHASQEIEASLVCFRDPPFPWGSVLLSASAFLSVSYIYARRDKLFRNKRKQF
ncbi:hypothetical protein AAZX31_19G019200 [Glycine max]|uniref:DUF7906 domain-containing protein n=1 Tax=Glycine soja TaxID=3848 RepID=A0A445FB50_GLYSO|nr:uncharacterized protein LOC100818221 [Glycine max]XP_028218075.1 uncharacterized protein LOC114400032 [Glycine soja]KAG4911608.1 hypothetical protein JHK86_052041 [Glycine max]KAG4926414.1 hypothetical protein JHK85_052900 [Glycine max]KAG5082050.1 hypothetical protein JHK84_052088 [Glycine max]KAG5084816.1 hypothetical protein JHK82_052213 [Glycine max]KAH1076038.1 hypothetical protein GYH30_051773 [Glycine max]